MTFGEKLTKARKEKGMTQKELAEKIGISDAMIVQYEKNLNYPRIDKLKKICTELDISADWLIF